MIDVLAIGAHPDDIEFFCAGTLILLKQQNYKTGILDLTRGENGSLGSAEERQEELEAASKQLELDYRGQLDLGDGRVEDNEDNRLLLIQEIRKLKPKLILSFLPKRRHPDHEATAALVKHASFFSSTKNILPELPAHKVEALWQFPELWLTEKPDVIVDITEVYDKKVEVMKCFKSQVITDAKEAGGQTLIKSQRFWDLHETRARQAGALSDCLFGEPFYTGKVTRISRPLDFLPPPIS